MPLRHEGPAPYTAPSAVTTVIDRSRQGTLPQPIDGNVLTRIGIPESLSPRTMASLRLLELVDGEGEPAPVLAKFQRAATDEFLPAVEAWLRGVYGEVFQIIGDPAQADHKRVEDAFRHHSPPGQRTRMVALFIGLLEYAGLLPDNSPLRGVVRSARRERPKVAKETRRAAARTANHDAKRGESVGSGKHAQNAASDREKREEVDLTPRGVDPIIAGLIRRLPPVDTEWPTAKRRAWLTAAEAAFDVLYELPADEQQEVMS